MKKEGWSLPPVPLLLNITSIPSTLCCGRTRQGRHTVDLIRSSPCPHYAVFCDLTMVLLLWFFPFSHKHEASTYHFCIQINESSIQVYSMQESHYPIPHTCGLPLKLSYHALQDLFPRSFIHQDNRHFHLPGSNAHFLSFPLTKCYKGAWLRIHTLGA